jgi:hypothetical protein
VHGIFSEEEEERVCRTLEMGSISINSVSINPLEDARRRSKESRREYSMVPSRAIAAAWTILDK